MSMHPMNNNNLKAKAIKWQDTEKYTLVGAGLIIIIIIITSFLMVRL